MQEYMAKKEKNQAGVLRRYTQSPRDEETTPQQARKF
jgi:hypothetical protein